MFFYKCPQSPGCFTANSQELIILFYFRAYAAYEDSIEVCPATEHEERKLLVEYLEKLKLYESNSVAQKMLQDSLEMSTNCEKHIDISVVSLYGTFFILIWQIQIYAFLSQK